MNDNEKQPDGAKDDRQHAPSECPICGRPTETRYRPFCSKRCSDIDLSRWLNGVYAVPAAEQEDEDGEQP